MKYVLSLIVIFCFSISLSAQWKLSGVIEDTQSGKNLKNVNISILGKDIETTTNSRGKFKIKVEDSTDVVIFSKHGYYEERVVVNNAKQIKVGLTQLMYKGEQVEDSYGTSDGKASTSAVTVLKTEDFNQGVATDIYQLLRGKVPGLVIKHDPKNPNAKPFIMLRASSNFSSNIEPLIIVDGIQNVSLDSVDPNDVAGVSVLRDGSAQAMYGSQATGGVIIITTKKK